MRRFLVHLHFAEDNFGTAALAAALVVMAFCFNIIGVVFTGLEHSLQIAVSAGIIYGLALFLDGGELPAWLPVAIILSPLLRYEGLPLSLAALLVLAMRGRWRTAVGTCALMVLLLASFSFFLATLGLPLLPSSILVKSTAAATVAGGAGPGLLKSFVGNVISMDHHNVGLLLLLIGATAAARCLWELLAKPTRWTSGTLMSLVLTCLIAGHAVAGRFGGLDRYEVYVLLDTALIGIYLTQEPIRRLLADKQRRRVLVSGAAVGLFIIGGRYVRTTMLVPLAANDICEQQMQMHRFVNDFYHSSVAVNDIGLVSYHNPNFVLDLWGLASEKARILKSSGAGDAAYHSLISSSGVHLVIIYKEWFPASLASGWEKVGSMEMSRNPVMLSAKGVQFYATDAATAAKVRDELRAFQKTLPLGVELTIY
jgi:hypothetical protein